MRGKERIIPLISLALIFGALATVIFGNVLSSVQTSRTVPSSGLVKGIGVGIYWNSACTNKTTSINWGLLEPGSNKTVTVYIRNEGNAAAALSLTTQNWNPTNTSTYITLNWNYAGQTLSVGQILQVKLTLVISPNITGIANFSFDTIISAIG